MSETIQEIFSLSFKSGQSTPLNKLIAHFLAGTLCGVVISFSLLFFSPWLSHHTLEIGFLHTMHSIFLYGFVAVITASVVYLLPYQRLAVFTYTLLPFPLIIWFIFYSNLEEIYSFHFYIGINVILWIGIIFTYVVSLYCLCNFKNSFRAVGYIIFGLIVIRLTLHTIIPSSRVFKVTQPPKSWSLIDKRNLVSKVFYPFSRSLYSQKHLILDRNSAVNDSIFVLVIDALRQDYLRQTTFDQSIATNLETFADKHLEFKNYRTASTWTKPSVASFFTGKHVREHGTFFGGEFEIRSGKYFAPTGSHVLVDRYETLAERLRKKGYRTLGFAINSLVSDTFGYDQGFQNYLTPTSGFHGDLYTLDQLIYWINESGNEQKFIYLHTAGVHWPYPHAFENEEFLEDTYFFDDGKRVYQPEYDLSDGQIMRETKLGNLTIPLSDQYFYRTLYASQLNYYDSNYFRRLRKLLRFIGFLEKGLFVVTADHGEQLFEERSFGHGRTLHESVIHVPLVMSLPGRDRESKKIFEDVGTVDLTASILDFSGASTKKISGQSFFGKGSRLDTTGISPGLSFSELVSQGMLGSDYEDNILKVAVIDSPRKLIFDYASSSGTLIHLNESRNLDSEDQSREDLKQALFDELGSDSGLKVQPTPLVPPKEQGFRNLKNLGYLE